MQPIGMGYPGVYPPEGPLQIMSQSVDSVGKISGLLQMASQAVHMCFSSFVQLAGSFQHLQMELGSGISLFSLFKFFFDILKRFEAFILRLFGRSSTLEEAWHLETQTGHTSS